MTPSKNLRFTIFFLVLAVLANTVLMKFGLNGPLRDLTRLGIIIGLLLVVFGGIYRTFSKKQQKSSHKPDQVQNRQKGTG